MRLPQSIEVIGIPRELQPALLLDKGDEHQPVEQALREQAAVLRGINPLNERLDAGEYLRVLFEEVPRDHLALGRLRGVFDVDEMPVILIRGGEDEERAVCQTLLF